jgi:hypothetical protein
MHAVSFSAVESQTNLVRMDKGEVCSKTLRRCQPCGKIFVMGEVCAICHSDLTVFVRMSMPVVTIEHGLKYACELDSDKLPVCYCVFLQ